MQHAPMDKTNRESVTVQGDAKLALEQLAESWRRPKKFVVNQLLEWVAQQDKEIQSLVLHSFDDDLERVVQKKLIQRLSTRYGDDLHGPGEIGDPDLDQPEAPSQSSARPGKRRKR